MMFPIFAMFRSTRRKLLATPIRRKSVWLAWGIWTLSMSLLAVNMTILLLMRDRPDPDAWSSFLLGLSFPMIGVLVSWRRPENAIGWLISSLGITIAVLSVSKSYALYGLRYRSVHLPGDITMAWLSSWLFGLIVVFLGLIIFLFPTGRFLSSRWLLLAWIFVGNSVVQICFSLFLPGDLNGFPGISNPIAMDGKLGHIIIAGADIAYKISLVCLFIAVLTLFFRYWRAKQEERHQIKWVVSALALCVLLTSIDPFIPPGFWGTNIDGFGALLLVLVMGVALFRYKLWEIDLIINRMLVYVLLSICVITIYMLVVVSFGALLQSNGNLLISLAATGFVAIVFQPLRGYLQKRVNRLLYGQRDEPYTVITRLSRRLENVLTTDEVLPTIVETVASALKLPAAVFELEREGVYEPVAIFGRATIDMITLPLSYQGETVGRLRLAPRTPNEAFIPADWRMLEELARHAGLAVYAARLNLDLQRSRERIVTAREEERRRLRRDLHDGLGAKLAAFHLQAGAIRMLLRNDLDAAEKELIDLQTEIRDVVTDIRRLVYGLRPPALDELGLIEAIRQHALQYRMNNGLNVQSEDPNNLRIEVEAPEQLSNVPAAMEVAAFRIVQEALTNAVRHSQARLCTIRLALSDKLEIEILDDGVGLPPSDQQGVGFLSIRERAAELGGTCIIESAAEGGTRVAAQFPIRKEH